MLHSFSNFRGDVSGGIVSAAVAIPLAMGYGMFAFVALGESYFASGALAGLYTAFVVAIVCVFLGDKTTTVYAPRINSTFFIGLLIYGLAHSDVPAIKSGGVPLILTITFAIILLGGLLQFIFGLIRIGSLIKFAPQPVMAGFQNAAAILLFLVQLGNVCGFDFNIAFTQIASHLDSIKPLSVLIAIATFLVMWNAHKLPIRIPPVITGITFGTGFYYFFQATGFEVHLGPVIVSEPHAIMGFIAFPYIASLAQTDAIFALAPTIVGGALALAFISSIDALLCAKLVTPLGERAADSDKLLQRLGVGNMAASCVGGITSGLNIGPSLTNRAFGGRTPLAVIVNAIAILVACTVLFPVAGLMPRVVLSAVIMVVAIQHLDAWSLRVLRGLATGTAPFVRTAALDLAIVFVVAILSVTIDIVLAVFVGIAIAILLFVVKMSRSVIRRSYRCGAVRSRKSRTAEERDLLGKRGDVIFVLDLQGALFFGTSEKLANDIDSALAQETLFVVLDLRRINEIDGTGALMLRQIDASLASKHKTLFLVASRQSLAHARMHEFNILETIPAERIFSDVDRAIERAEDALLCDRILSAEQELPVNQVGLLINFSEFEIATIVRYLDRCEYAVGQTIFREGEPGQNLLMVTKGSASAYLQLPNGEQIRLATFGPGTIFGELALLDGGLRSATIVADDSLVCYSLNKSEFDALATQTPAVAIKLLATLSRELSGRLRVANRTIQQLEM
jgi:sulfate permease, SulP family